MRKFHDLPDLQRQDAERAERKPGFWHRVSHWSKRAKDVAGILAVGGTLLSGAARLFQLVRARSISPAVEPPTGVASTALDTINEPAELAKRQGVGRGNSKP